MSRLLWCVVLTVVGVVPALPAQDINALLKDGKAKVARQAFKAALTPLDAAVKLDPTNAEARRWRGHCRNALGMYADALVDYDEAIRLAPGNFWSWYARGRAKHNLSRFQAAIADYTQCLKLNPDYHQAMEWRGFTRTKVGDHVGAYLDFNRAAKLDPENPWVYFSRGKVLCNLGDLQRARKDFLTSLRLDPKQIEAQAELGFLLVAMGDNDGALKAFDKAIQIDPAGEDRALLWRYWLRAASGKAGEEAKKELPADGWARDLGKVLLGQMTQEQLKEALEGQAGEVNEVPNRRCEAAFFLGLRALLVGQRDVARKHLEKAVVEGNQTMPEWRAARRLTRR